MRDASGPVRAVFPNQAFLRDVFHPQQRVVLYGPVEYRGRRSAVHQPGVRDRPRRRRRRRRRDGPHRPHRADLREGRIGDAADAADAGASAARHAARGPAGPDAGRRFASGEGCPTGGWRSPNRTFRRQGTDVAALNAFRTPAQQRLIFEEFFLFQAGPRAAQAPARRRSEAARRSSWTTGSASRRGACCRSSSPTGRRPRCARS